jgi:hypothetical protein
VSDFDLHMRRTVFWMRIKIFAIIVAYEAAIALVLAALVYYFSPTAAWWTFFVSFGVLSFYGLNREFGIVLAIAFTAGLLLVALFA